VCVRVRVCVCVCVCECVFVKRVGYLAMSSMKGAMAGVRVCERDQNCACEREGACVLLTKVWVCVIAGDRECVSMCVCACACVKVVGFLAMIPVERYGGYV